MQHRARVDAMRARRRRRGDGDDERHRTHAFDVAVEVEVASIGDVASRHNLVRTFGNGRVIARDMSTRARGSETRAMTRGMTIMTRLASRRVRRASTAGDGGVGASRRLMTFLCERAPFVDFASQREAFESRAYDGAVHPDFPSSSSSAAAAVSVSDAESASMGAWVPAAVRTVAGSACEDVSAIRRRALDAVEASRGVERCAILCVSGDARADVGRGMTSEDVLRELSSMRRRGDVPRETTLLAVANPMLGAVEAERMMRKRELGAEGFITQPGFLRERFDRWRDAADRVGALDGFSRDGGPNGLAGLFLGVCAPRSAKNIEFWCALTGVDVDADAEARTLRDEYARRARDMSRERFDDWTFERVELALVHAVSFERALGAHVMPVTKGGYAHAARLARDVLPIFRV